MTAALSSAMENMAFEQVDIPFAGMPGPEIEERNLWAVLPILRPAAGEIAIRISEDYVKTLTTSLFEGSDKLVSDELTKDALAEILNTIAGCLMARLVSPMQEFELGLPKVTIGESHLDRTGHITYDFDIGGHLVSAFVLGITAQVNTNTKTDK